MNLGTEDRNLRTVLARWTKSLRGQRAMLLAGIVTLGTAFAISAVSFAIVDAAWLRPFLFERVDQLFYVTLLEANGNRLSPEVPGAFFTQWRTDAKGAALGAYSFDLQPGDSSHRPVIVGRVSAGILKVLGLSPVLGRELSETDEVDGRVAMLSFGAWQRDFGGDPSAIGREYPLGAGRVTIVGVAPAAFVLPLLPPAVAVYVPAALSTTAGSGDAASSVRVIGRLPEGGSFEDVTRNLRRAVADVRVSGQAATQGPRVTSRPLTTMVTPSLTAVPLFASAIAAILLLSLINIAHLQYARVLARERDLAIRLALGADSARLLTAGIPAIFAMALGSWLVAYWTTVAILGRSGSELQRGLSLPRPPATSPLLWWLGVGIATLMAVAIASVVLVTVWRRLSLRSLRPGEGGVGQRSRTRLQKWLLASQQLLAAVLLSTAAVAGTLLVRLVTSDVGIDPNNVVASTISFRRGVEPAGAVAMLDDIERDLRGVPGVESMSMVDLLPYLIMPSFEAISTQNRPTPETVSVRRVDWGYFDTLRIDRVAGRSFNRLDLDAPPSVAVVSKGLAQAYGSPENIIGMSLRVGDRPPVTIVGVVEDVRDVSLDRPASPTLYVPYTDRAYRRFAAGRGLLVRVDPSREAATTKLVAEALGRHGAVANIDSVRPLESRTAAATRTPRVYAALSAVFGWVALLFAGFGTYTMVAHVAAERRYDIAVRLMCGATPRLAMGKLLADVLWPCICGLTLGLLAGSFVSRAFLGLVSADAEVHFSTTLLAAGVVLATAVLGAWRPARRAGLTDPLPLLRRS